MIYIGLGSNLSSVEFGSSEMIITAALECFCDRGIAIVGRSPLYHTQPLPISDQPWFINAVAAVATTASPAELLARLHGIEADFGRLRRERWEARVLDLDLLAYNDKVQAGDAGRGEPILPHPRLAERAFVLRPLADLDPGWRHPVTGRTVIDLLRALPPDQIAEPLVAG